MPKSYGNIPSVLPLMGPFFLASFLLLIETASAQPTPPPAPHHSPAAVAQAAVNSLSLGCAGHLGSAEGIEQWARQQNFSPVRPEVSALFPVNIPSSVFVLQSGDDRIALVFQGDGLQCRIYAQRADVDIARSYFISVLEGVRRPGLTVEKQPERETVQGGQRVLQIGYIVRSETQIPGQPDRLVLITLNRAPDAKFAIIATAAVVSRR